MKIAIGTLKMKKTYGRHGDSTWTSAHAMKIGKFKDQFIGTKKKRLIAYHLYSLEKNHAIQCGYSIKCSQTIPDELYEHLGLDVYEVESPFTACSEYVQSVFLTVDEVE